MCSTPMIGRCDALAMEPTTNEVLTIAELLGPVRSETAVSDAHDLMAGYGWSDEEVRFALVLACGLVAGLAARLDEALDHTGTLAELMLLHAVDEALGGEETFGPDA